jgi:uncharacterized RDD family membrane protein YckC
MAVASDYELDTPEAVRLDFEIAGIGTRFLAALLDLLVIIGLGIAIGLLSLILYALGGPYQTVAEIVGVTLSFILFWGYYIISEAVTKGRSPGKAKMRIRVIKTTGYPEGFVAAVVRNLVRIVDFLPVLYGVGIVTMFINKNARRLGDLAAGTVVVKERKEVLEPSPSPTLSGVLPGMVTPARGQVNPEEHDWALTKLTSDDILLVTHFLSRAPSLPSDATLRVGNQIAERLAATIGASPPLDPVRFLERVLCLGEREP